MALIARDKQGFSQKKVQNLVYQKLQDETEFLALMKCEMQDIIQLIRRREDVSQYD